MHSPESNARMGDKKRKHNVAFKLEEDRRRSIDHKAEFHDLSTGQESLKSMPVSQLHASCSALLLYQMIETQQKVLAHEIARLCAQVKSIEQQTESGVIVQPNTKSGGILLRFFDSHDDISHGATVAGGVSEDHNDCILESIDQISLEATTDYRPIDAFQICSEESKESHAPLESAVQLVGATDVVEDLETVGLWTPVSSPETASPASDQLEVTLSPASRCETTAPSASNQLEATGTSVAEIDRSQPAVPQPDVQDRSIQDSPVPAGISEHSSYDQLWNCNFAKLQSYRAQHGHVFVDQSEVALKMWIQRQRRLFRVSSLPTDRFELLNLLDPCWHQSKRHAACLPVTDVESSDIADLLHDMPNELANDMVWNRRFRQLQCYKTKYGDLCLTKKQDSTLYMWLKKQRQVLPRGATDTSKARNDALNRLDSKWFVPASAWQKNRNDF